MEETKDEKYICEINGASLAVSNDYTNLISCSS